MKPMSTTFNPFPAYPVVRLLDGLENIKAITIDTEAIIQSRNFVEQYAKQWQSKREKPDMQITPLVVAIKGDYGTGKTHLLLDAAAGLADHLNELKCSPIFIRLTCIGADPVTWYRAVLGPTLMQPFVSEAIVDLYARAGQDVAAEVKLTGAAVAKLVEDPTLIHSLVRDNLLSSSAVNERFDSLLKQICKDCEENVRRAFTAMVWGETSDAALQWLAGKTPTEYELEKLGISNPLSLEIEASGVIVGLAAIHSYLGRPFGLMIDEMEHLTQYDLSQGNRNNLTWLKRLLEGLSSLGSIVYVAGHWSAWENGVQSDYLDRFSQLRPITLLKLTAADIENIVHTKIPNLDPKTFDDNKAQAVVEMTGGNMRRVMSLCHQLFKKTDGFSQPLERELILATAIEIGQRKSLDEIILGVHELLEKCDLRVEKEGNLEGGWQFDVVAYAGNMPRVVAEFKHTVTQAVQRGIARRSFDRIGELQKLFPNVIGLFFFDGSIDDEQLKILSAAKDAGIFYFDLGQSELLSEVAKVLHTHLEISSGAEHKEYVDSFIAGSKIPIENPNILTKEQEDRLQELKQQPSSINIHIADLVGKNEAFELNNEKIQRQLDELEKKRAQELKEFQDHIASLSEKITEKRDKEVVSLGNLNETDQLNLIYKELTQPQGFWAKLRGIRSFSLLIIVSNWILAFMTIGVPFSEKTLMIWFDSYSAIEQLKTAVSSILVLIGIFYFIWEMVQLERYHEFSCRILRTLYLRRASPVDLTKADLILKESIDERKLGDGKQLAIKRLCQTFPEVVYELIDKESFATYPK